MTATEQSEKIIEISVIVQRLEKSLSGNGQPGLIDRFNTLEHQHQIVYDRQKNCISNQQAKKVDIKYLVLLGLTIVALVKEYIF